MLGDRRTRPRPGGAARWAPLAGVAALVLCGCTSGYLGPAIIGSVSPSAIPAGPAGTGSGGGLTVADAVPPSRARTGPVATGGHPTYAVMARRAVATLEGKYYNGAGRWNMCVPLRCSPTNRDWGADSLTYTLYLDWTLSHDQTVPPIMNALVATSPKGHSGASDVPLWDSIAAAREYQVTGNPEALQKAVGDFGYVAGNAKLFALGACPSILYQHANGGGNDLKTLETGSNYVKAALLLYQITHRGSYLTEAEDQYRAIRRYFLSADVPLYTVYVFDNGTTCQQVPAQYFASVNGNMIWAGYYLARATGNTAYLSEAIATAKAVAAHLGDPTGVYADLQADNDVAEPLIEAMYDLATAGHQQFARRWLLAAASASASDIVPRTGAYGRFFDGPPPQAPVTAWQANGGLALAQAAGALDPGGRPSQLRFWAGAQFVRDGLRLVSSPVKFTFTGRAVAIIGTIGEVCCEPGHARLLIDGTQTFDQTGIWQNKSPAGIRLPGSVLFAWRWPARGTHTIEIAPPVPNAKQGGTYFHMVGYDVVK